MPLAPLVVDKNMLHPAAMDSSLRCGHPLWEQDPGSGVCVAHTPCLLQLEDNGQVHKPLPQPSVSAPLLQEGRDANRDRSGPDGGGCDAWFCGLCQHRAWDPHLSLRSRGKAVPGVLRGWAKLGVGWTLGGRLAGTFEFLCLKHKKISKK